MLRPHEASETRSPFPLVQAGRADAAGRECIPRCSAPSIEVFGVLNIPTHPSVDRSRAPLAQRTTDARYLEVFRFVEKLLGKIFGLIAKTPSSCM
jgi:hypothetical protein